MKRIIVCLDGTWNTAERGGPVTNVVRIRDGLVADMELDGEPQQRIYYDEGVGTRDPLDALPGGGLGIGLTTKVRQAYKYICRHYEAGDEIYLIGFSRGAFTARSVAGYIGACGVLRSEECTTARETAAWNHYRTTQKSRASGDRAALAPFCHENVRIKCVAVFDTVGALGIPGVLNFIGRTLFSFHDTQLTTCVDNCFHALAIDERRMTFAATVWEEPFNFAGALPNVRQVWFPGVHGDIGGGYREDELSRNALDWMIGRLMELGVRFLPHAEPKEDKRKPLGMRHESRKLPLYALSYLWPRHRPIDAVPVRGRMSGEGEAIQYRPIFEYVHRSALDRWKAGSRYRPPNLREVLPLIANGYLAVIDWDGSEMAQDAVMREFGDILPEKPPA